MNVQPAPQRPWPLFWYAIAGTVALILIDLFTKPAAESILREAGGIEMASAMLYGYAAGVWLWLNPGDEWKRNWQIPAVMLLMMGREFDLDKELVSIGILKSSLYFTSEASLIERIFGALVLAFLVIVLLRLVRENGLSWFDGLRRRAAWAWAVLASFGLAVGSKIIDGIGRKLDGLIDIGTQAEVGFEVLEELAEMCIPLMFLVATLLIVRAGGTGTHRRRAW